MANMDIDLLSVEIAMDHNGCSPALLKSGSDAYQRICSGVDLDALDYMRPSSTLSQVSQDGIGEEIVDFLRTNPNLSSGDGKELLDVILNDDLQGSSATEMIRKASMRTEGNNVVCDELLQLSDEQLSQFLHQPAEAPVAVTNQAAAVNHAIPRCPTGHQCVPSVKIDGVYSGGEFACDKCANIRSVTLERWHCAICSVDFCYTCTPAVQPVPNSQSEGSNTANSSVQCNSEAERAQDPQPKVVYPKGDTDQWNRREPAFSESPIPAREADDDASFTRGRSYEDVDDKAGKWGGKHSGTKRLPHMRNYQDLNDGADEWEGQHIVMKKGKYQGRHAYVKQCVNKKYRVSVDGVDDQLEFYPTSFSHVQSTLSNQSYS